MRPIFMPERARALSADWAPGPGVLVLFPPVALSFMWRAVMPSSCVQALKNQEAFLDQKNNINHQKILLKDK